MTDDSGDGRALGLRPEPPAESRPSASIPVADALRKARRILEEKDWIQFTLAADADGFATSPLGSDACGYCLLGAVTAATGSCREYEVVWDFLHELGLGGAWNDAPGRTKEEVLAALDRAIALATTGPKL